MSDQNTQAIEQVIETYEKNLAYATRTPWTRPNFTDSDATLARALARKQRESAEAAYQSMQRHGIFVDESRQTYEHALDTERRADALAFSRDAYFIRKPFTYVCRIINELQRYWQRM